jgi:uncharacterized membrane protein
LTFKGYSLIKVLFPTREIDNIDARRVALSIGISLALIPITGLLNYTLWNIRTILVTLSLLALNTIFTTVAIMQKQHAKPKNIKHSRVIYQQIVVSF